MSLPNPKALLFRIKAEKASRSLYEYVKQAWPVLEPAYPYLDNWHVEAVCDCLEAVVKGQIQKLVINIPPGHAKSTLAAVAFPTWVWIKKPEWRGIFASYAHDLAVRDAVKARNVMESEWYQNAFVLGRDGMPAWKLSDDMNRKDFYTNTKTGMRLSMSVGSKATGFRGNCVLVDDPLNAKEAPSKIARDEAIFWWDQVMSTRVNNPSKDAKVIIMQRLHEDDLAGHVLRSAGYEHLKLPSEFNPAKRCRVYVRMPGIEERVTLFEDPRTEKGELLFPALYPQMALAEARSVLRDGYAGQHDQEPTAAEGGMFKYKWLRFYKSPWFGDRPRECLTRDESPAIDLPANMYLIGSVDASFKDNADNDPVSIQIWGAWKAMRFLIDNFTGVLNEPETEEKIKTFRTKYPKVRKWLVEDKANGPAIVQRLRSQIPGIMEVTPEGGKESRAYAVQPLFQAYQIYMPDGAPWLQSYADELCAFPRGRHDDQVDATSQALNHLCNPDAMKLLASLGLG